MTTSKSYLSKSKLMSGRQCPKRLWLEVNRPELLEFSPATERSFAVGHTVGHAARWPFPAFLQLHSGYGITR